MYAIEVSNLSKKFKFNIKDKNKGFFYNLVHPIYKEIIAINNISFKINGGETVAFIGPNGAGKSTTIKILTGIILPSSGYAKIYGLTPIKDRNKLSQKIGTVFGQRSQLLPNLPVTDSLEMFGVLYDMSTKDIQFRIRELTEVLDLKNFIEQPIRKLSLGQRMKAEIAASLMHKPKIIFLDEPTIGLDVIAKKKLRDLLVNLNKHEKITIFLTSHDTEDIESICRRCIIMNKGKIVVDTETTELMRTQQKVKIITLTAATVFEEFIKLPEGVQYIKASEDKIIVSVNTEILNIRQALQELTKLFDVNDVNINNNSLENIIRSIYETN